MEDFVLIPDSPGTSLSDLLQLQYKVIPLQQQSSLGLTGLPGLVQSSHRGKGLDFDDLRRYFPGDDVRYIDWNVTARTQMPHIRLFREDQERSVTVAVDLRPSMFTGSTCYRADRAIRFAALTLWQACLNGDRCSVVVYDNDGIHSSRPRMSKRGVLDGLGLMMQRYSLMSEVTNRRSDPELDRFLKFLINAGRVAGSIVLFSALDTPGESIQRVLKTAGAKQNLCTVMLIDPIELALLPAGQYPFRFRSRTRNVFLNAFSAKQLQTLLYKKYNEKLQLWTDNKIPALPEKDIVSPTLVPRWLYQQGRI